MNESQWISYAEAIDYAPRRTLERYVSKGRIRVWRRNKRFVLLLKADVIKCFVPPDTVADSGGLYSLQQVADTS